MKNFIFISPNFPVNYWKFCSELKNNGLNVLGIGDQPYDELTEELKAQILAAETLVVVEDLYRPYRPKRRTRAIIAREKGLEGLANIISLQMTDQPLEVEAESYLSAEKGVDSIIKNDMKIGISCIPQYTVEKIEVDFSEEDARRFRLI